MKQLQILMDSFVEKDKFYGLKTQICNINKSNYYNSIKTTIRSPFDVKLSETKEKQDKTYKLIIQRMDGEETLAIAEDNDDYMKIKDTYQIPLCRPTISNAVKGRYIAYKYNSNLLYLMDKQKAKL